MNYRLALCCMLLVVSAGRLEAAGHRSPSPEGAAVGFANLSDGDIVPPEFVVQFNLAGMAVAPAGTQMENTGHHHLLIDVAGSPDLEVPLPMTDQVRHFGTGQTETVLQLAEGEHTLQLLLADHAHIPHDPPVISDVITVTVSAAAPPPAER